MIHIIHGQDTTSSYNFIEVLLGKYPNYQKIRFTHEHTREDFKESLLSQNLFSQNKTIICEDYLFQKKITAADINQIPQNQDVIFWESQKIKIADKIKNASIQEFKKPAILFQFLDSVSPKSTSALLLLRRLTNESNLIWHLAYRLQLLIFAKKGLPKEAVANFLKKPVATWQWQKIQNQAKYFQMETLNKIFSSLLKIDYLKKQGKTQLNDTTLLTLLFLKHLKS